MSRCGRVAQGSHRPTATISYALAPLTVFQFRVSTLPDALALTPVGAASAPEGGGVPPPPPPPPPGGYRAWMAATSSGCRVAPTQKSSAYAYISAAGLEE